MITNRFQAWRITKYRANEFRRTRRARALPRPMLMRRVLGLGDETAGLYFDRPSKKTRKRFKRGDLVRCRPAARTAPFIGSFHSGPLHCARSVTSLREFYSDDRPYPRGRPPCAVAVHRLETMRYIELPF